jgi:hypothetical protein
MNVSGPVFATYIMFFGNLNSSVNPFIWFFFNFDMVKTALSPFFDERYTTRYSTVNRSSFLTVRTAKSSSTARHSPESLSRPSSELSNNSNNSIKSNNLSALH